MNGRENRERKRELQAKWGENREVEQNREDRKGEMR